MKKRTLRAIAVIITLIMLVNAVPLAVFAIENTESAQAMGLSVSSVNGIPRETVQVTINLKNNPGLASLKFNVEYDEALTLTDVQFNSAFGSYVTTPEPYANPQAITLISPLNDVSEEGTLATLTFHVSEETLDGYVAEINITYNTDDVYNGDYENIVLAVVNGSVTIYHGVPGDIDGDLKVNTKDAILLFRYVAGWSVDVDPDALDVNGDNKVNTKDAVTLFRYVAGWKDITLHRGKTCAHKLTYISEVAATCTQTGTQAYWSCELCGRKFSDSQANNQIETAIVIPFSGHKYSEIWSSDSAYHWHSAICEHNEEITGKSEHTLNANGVCTICGFESVVTVTLDTPVISKVEYDTVYWYPVNNADTYTIRVNDNYECTLRGTSCSLADVKWNGNIISNYGYVTISVRANGYDNYTSSDWSDTNSTYYYVPESQDSMANNLIKYSIGYGYNLIEDEYFDITLASQNSILNVKKLLTIGNCVPKVHSGGTGTSYNYESIDEFISKTKLSVEYNQETGCMLIGSLKMQISADLGFDYRSYEYNNTYVYEYKWTYKDYTVTDILDDNLLMYCLSDNFLKDIRRESNSTFGLSDEQLFEYLFDKYGTHAILGITTGGRYTAQYIIQTNSKDVALNVKTAFDLSTGGGGAIGQIIQKDFGIGIDLSEDLSWKNSDTEAHYITHIYGGSGGGATSASGVDSAIKDWTKSLSEDNARSVAITQNGAIALSSLISYVDVSLGSKYADYVERKADESYKQLYSQYTKPTTLPMEVVKESGQNVLKIDISNYQSIGTLADTYNPNLLDDTLTIHQTMLGKSIEKIHIIGGMGDNESQKLIDSFSIQLSKEWKRNVDIVIENLGVICKSDKGFIDTSLLKNSSVVVNIKYLGVNVIQTTDGTYTFRTCINSVDKNITFVLPKDETLDITTVRLYTSGVCLPVAERVSYVFAGWFDSNENLVADALGNLSFEYDGDSALVHAKWIPSIYEITLDNQSATNGGSSKFYEQYTVGMFADFEGTSALTAINIPSKTGFVFGGYYESVENNSTSTAVGTNQYVSPDGIITTCFTSFNADTTLYALWIPQVFEISLDNQGATISGTVSYYEKYITGIYDDRECNSDLVIIDVPEKNGFTFGGYFEGVNGTGAQRIKADGTIIATNDTYTENATLYALWTINTLNVTHDYSFNTFEVNNTIGGSNGYYTTLTDYFDMAALKNQGYTMKVTMNFNLKEIDAGSDGKYKYNMMIFNGPGDTYTKLFETGTQTISIGTKSFSYSTSISANSLSRNELGFLFTEETYSAFGIKTNSYNVIGLVMTVTFVK